MFISRDLVFDEKHFPFATIKEDIQVPNDSTDATHCFWQIDGVINDDWSAVQLPQSPEENSQCSQASMVPASSGPRFGQPSSNMQ